MENTLFDRLMNDFDFSLNRDGVSGERVAERLYQLSQIGLTQEDGSFRIGFSAEEKQAKTQVKSWMEIAGLTVKEDGAGNIIGRLEGKNKHLPAIASGSHVDSVPNGGHFDGPLGVIAALEVAEAWKTMNYQPEKPYEIIIFTDEEGVRFNGGFTGSKAMMGSIDYVEQLKLIDGDGNSFEQVLEVYGSTFEKFKNSVRNEDIWELFVEIHIEQGKRLEKMDLPVGIVTGIAGPCWLEITFIGEAGHAGNTPMNDRKDSLAAASEFVFSIEELPSTINSSSVATVGKLNVFPNGVNVIPGNVTLFVDIRDIFESTKQQLVALIKEKANSIGEKRDINVLINDTLNIEPVPIQKEIQQKLEESVVANGVEPYFLPSGAGHDSMIVGKQLPVAMIFVRSKDGISHNPKEWSTLNDCLTAVHVLKDFLEKAMQESPLVNEL